MSFTSRLAPYFNDYRLLFFIGAIFLYGSFSSPTPDNPSIIEAIIVLLLLLAVGIKGLYAPIFGGVFLIRAPKWRLAAFVLLLYGLLVPVISALYHDIALSVFLRDMIGFVSLCIPLFLAPFILETKRRQQMFLIGLLFIGIAFSIRVLFLDFSFFSKREELLYLANSPLVLLSALYLSLTAISKMKSILIPQSVMIVIASILLAVLPLAAMYIDFQRASFLALGFSVLAVLGLSFIKAPQSIILPVIVLGLIGILFSAQIVDIIESISVKTSQVGLNMRAQELQAVWSAVSGSNFSLFFGLGWGASFTSPAVGDLNVSYTHSLITYMLLKTGMIGLGLTLIYLFFMFEKVARLVFIEPVKGNALIWSFLIPILFYASYKSLDYGFILVLILVLDAQIRTNFSKK